MARGNEKKKSKKKPVVVDLVNDEEITFPAEEEEAIYEVEKVVDRRCVILSIYLYLIH
jgi:hypothetical protein